MSRTGWSVDEMIGSNRHRGCDVPTHSLLSSWLLVTGSLLSSGRSLVLLMSHQQGTKRRGREIAEGDEGGKPKEGSPRQAETEG